MIIEAVSLFLWIRYRRESAESSIRTFSDKLNATKWSVRSVSLKMAGGALLAAFVTGGSVLSLEPPRGDARSPRTPGLLLGSVLFAAVTGALIGYLLAVRDLVLERRSSGQRVNPVMQAYFCWGVASLILWFITLFAVGIDAIAFYYSFLSPGPGRAH
jgi:hypothetical protein